MTHKPPYSHLKPEQLQYIESLGYFITMFSLAESTMQDALWHFAGITPPIAGIIFSGTRIEAAGGYIKRIGQATGWSNDQKASFHELTAQLGEITQTRNDLLHFGPKLVEGDQMITTNEKIAHTIDAIRKTKISPKILDRMSHDILLIWIQMSALMGKFNGELIGHLLSPEALKHAWHYKPEREGGRSKKRPQSTPVSDHARLDHLRR